MFIAPAFDPGRKKQAKQQTAYCHTGDIPTAGNTEFVGFFRTADDRGAADPGSKP